MNIFASGKLLDKPAVIMGSDDITAHGNWIWWLLLTFSCHDTPLGVVNFKSDEKSDHSIDIFQPIRMLHFEEIFHKIDTPTYEKSDKKSDWSVTYWYF
jgi:hypothetical protein